jgi:hypothetical protein
MTHEIADLALRDCAGAREIGFAIPQAYDASRRHRPRKRAMTAALIITEAGGYWMPRLRGA